MITKKKKIALILDNCSAHPKVIKGIKNVNRFFLTPNTISVAQQMDQGIIRNFKLHYRAAINNKRMFGQ
jgi:hypothetical protein